MWWRWFDAVGDLMYRGVGACGVQFDAKKGLFGGAFDTKWRREQVCRVV